jgi:hypothetical protein
MAMVKLANLVGERRFRNAQPALMSKGIVERGLLPTKTR